MLCLAALYSRQEQPEKLMLPGQGDQAMSIRCMMAESCVVPESCLAEPHPGPELEVPEPTA